MAETRHVERKRKGFILASAGLLSAEVGAIALFGFIMKPSSPFYPRCVFYWLTRLYCPGCGTGRGMRLILRGEVLAGLRENFMLVPGLLTLLWLNVWFFARALRPAGKLPGALDAIERLFSSSRFAFVVLVTISAWWILRNLPWFPFTLLAPR